MSLTHNLVSVYMCVCVCMCVCMCVRVCVSLRPSTVNVLSVRIRWDSREKINDVMLKALNSYPDSYHRYFRMQNLTFQPAALFCSHTRSGKSHDLTIVLLAFRTWDLHSPLTGVAFGVDLLLHQHARERLESV